MITRRKFLTTSAIFGTSLVVHPWDLAFSSGSAAGTLTAPLLHSGRGETLITILHTNDTHSQIDPLPAVYRALASSPAGTPGGNEAGSK